MKIFLFIVALTASGLAQNFTGGFNFNLPYDDTTTSRFLPSFPKQIITNVKFIGITNDGNFEYNGTPIRFWGTNLVAGSAFPDKSKAWFIAGRLRKLGFNLVRFHHMDNPWSSESILEYGSDTRHLYPATLDRLEYIISNLKSNGIFANINLNVSRQFKTQDGVPVADSLVQMAKGVTLFDPILIALEKEYATQLLTHVNPYTGLALVNDPVMAMVEIVNENSLYRIWRDNELKLFADGGWLTLRHNKILDSLWNNFLISKYATTTALASAWNQGASQIGTNNLVINGGFESPALTNWILEQDNGAAGTFSKDITTYSAGTASAKVIATHATGTAWNLQFKQISLNLKKDTVYNIQFMAKSDSLRTISAVLMRDNDPYTYYGGQDFQLTTQWKLYTFSVKPTENNSGYGRLSFEISKNGIYWFDDVKLTTTGTSGLLAGESLESRNVKRIDFSSCGSFTDQRVKDISQFYIDLQDSFYLTMKNYLKNVLGVKVPIVGTNFNVGPADMTVQSKLDYTDNHSYWDHPSFPGILWSSTDWYINNTPMLKDAGAGTIPGLFAGTAFKGKPYTISEYNHPFPNRYQTEALLFITAYSSFHNTDGLMFFDYNSGSSWEDDIVSSYFSINRNNAMMSLVPSCSFAFRNRFISESIQPVILHYKKEDVLLLPKKDSGGWNGISLFDNKAALIHSIKTESYDADSTTDFTSFPQYTSGIYKTDTDEILLNTKGMLTVGSKNFCSAAGFFHDYGNTKAGNLTVITGSDFGVVTWVSLNGDSLPRAKTSLITVSSKIQNTNMVWEGTTTIHNNWGTSPTQISPLSIVLSLEITADSIYVYPLDSKGKESIFSVLYPSQPGIFNLFIDQNNSKTLWFGIERFSNISDTRDRHSTLMNYDLEQNYPNPFNGYTTFKYVLPKESSVSFIIYDILGRRVKTLQNQKLSAGTFNISWDGKDENGKEVVSGIYFANFVSDNFISTKKMIMLK
jgi:hypothetical protein